MLNLLQNSRDGFWDGLRCGAVDESCKALSLLQLERKSGSPSGQSEDDVGAAEPKKSKSPRHEAFASIP